MRWRRFFRRRRADAELREEMNVHLETEIEENLARGYSLQEARRAARLKFGNPQQMREKVWRQNTFSGFDTFARNLKYGARALRRSPGFALASIVVIALGIGVNAALFTVVRSVLLRPLPFPESDGWSGSSMTTRPWAAMALRPSAIRISLTIAASSTPSMRSRHIEVPAIR